MKRWVPPVGFLLLALAAAVYMQQRQSGGRAGFPAPDFVLSDLQGRQHRLSQFRGKIVFLNVWATWCPPCRMEMPSMEHLHRRLQGKEFVMLAVSEDEGGVAGVRNFINKLGVTFTVLMDPEGIVPSRYGVTGYPETFVIDREGHVIQHTIGPEDWNSESSYRYFSALLEDLPDTTQATGEANKRGG